MSLDEAESRLVLARRIPFPKNWVQLVSGMCGAFCFALIFGGTLRSALAAALAPELMGYSELTAIARNCAIQRATDALREALLSWLAKGEKINYSAQDSDILTTIGFRPDAASVDDSREKFTPAQNMIFSRKSAQLASRQSV